MTKNIIKFIENLGKILSLLLLVSTLASCAINTGIVTNSDSIYQYRTIHNYEGIGKFYLGREIAKVMGHEGAGWLERDSRTYQEKPESAINNLELKSTDIVADIGAGTGYFTFRMSPLVPEGKVLAIDIQPEMLELINFVNHEENITNVETILGDVDNPKIPPSSVDIALLVDTYHEFEYPREMMLGIVEGLKPGGRVVLLEYRSENPMIMIKGLHKMSEKQVKKEMKAVGLIWQDTRDFLPQQHFLVFKKPDISL
ncbi:Methyltransferase type 11 [Trichodesmium erythraeum IMS101]|uniref:Methyltransferase type 11 n=1 Tax=Trichodesmium erythraeum (strain IMS101) TaxID=203124 RepID=Q113E0_TRIEI|nr:class I SAM-dependent methyltransferase [Trichodesmium erythraeum GBRTRLIN201]MCH2049570.1 class I SAM-dependent methyltransferase [Trichodesmium sp. ALOHA_ZT_67]MDE5096198.1 class I SAM-dependent methyltransferase [Trichodesmium sp. St11_bin5]MDT9339362.1 class I SAM-dependent methyltransferase [Trichodesmium erythraeum 21-75]